MKCFFILITILISFNLLADGTLPTGAGTQADPFQIATLDNLLWVSTNDASWNSYFIQTTDIDAAGTSGWNSGQGFSPIGNDANPFIGSFNGLGYEIDGLFINRSWSDDQGLFGYTSGATIANLGVINVSITADDRSGSLVGYNISSVVIDCYAIGDVSGDNSIGGFIGRNLDSSVSGCFSSADVFSDGSSIGGLIGRNQDSSNISNCYSTGSVDGDDKVGGFVGYNYNSATVSNCYSTGDVNGGGDVGGLVGYNAASVINDLQSNWRFETVNRSKRLFYGITLM